MTRITTTAVALMITLGGSIAEAQAVRVSTPIYRPVAPIRIAPSPITSQPSTVAPAPAPTPARPGQLRAEVVENGAPAIASVEVRQAGQVVASGSTASPIQLPAGTYDVTLTLDGALDRPTRSVRVEVPEGGMATARASFSTAILEVRFTKDRAGVPGLATIRQGERVIGTLGSGVTARVSAGTYQIDARYRTEQRSYTVTLAPGQRRALSAAF